jgi:outer membrane protein OmpA-like peptidoglycan-associated protein
VQRIEPKTKELGESQARHVYDDDSEAEGVSVASGSVADAPEAPESPGAIQKHENFAIGNILFEFNSAELADGHEELLAPLVSHLKSVPFKKLDIEGYTDSVGKPAYNLDLSRRRSQSVRNYLIKFAGLTASKITASGFGATHPIASNSNYQGRQANRRVEFKIEH